MNHKTVIKHRETTANGVEITRLQSHESEYTAAVTVERSEAGVTLRIDPMKGNEYSMTRVSVSLTPAEADHIAGLLTRAGAD
jgi:hypothetical protein